MLLYLVSKPTLKIHCRVLPGFTRIQKGCVSHEEDFRQYEICKLLEAEGGGTTILRLQLRKIGEVHN